MDQCGCGEGGESWTDPGSVSEVDTTILTNGLDDGKLGKSKNQG